MRPRNCAHSDSIAKERGRETERVLVKVLENFAEFHILENPTVVVEAATASKHSVGRTTEHQAKKTVISAISLWKMRLFSTVLSKTVSADLQVLGAALCFGVGFIAQRALSLQGLAPLACNGLRFAISAICVCLTVWLVPAEWVSGILSDGPHSESTERKSEENRNSNLQCKKDQLPSMSGANCLTRCKSFFSAFFEKGSFGTRLRRFYAQNKKSALYWGTVLGLLNFLGSGLQQVGITYTSANKVGFIAGFDLFLTPILVLCMRHCECLTCESKNIAGMEHDSVLVTSRYDLEQDHPHQHHTLIAHSQVHSSFAHYRAVHPTDEQCEDERHQPTELVANVADEEKRVMGADVDEEEILPSTWLAVLISIVGLFLLSDASLSDFSLGYGEYVTLLSTVFWTLHITSTDIATDYLEDDADEVIPVSDNQASSFELKATSSKSANSSSPLFGMSALTRMVVMQMIVVSVLSFAGSTVWERESGSRLIFELFSFSHSEVDGLQSSKLTAANPQEWIPWKNETARNGNNRILENESMIEHRDSGDNYTRGRISAHRRPQHHHKKKLNDSSHVQAGGLSFSNSNSTRNYDVWEKSLSTARREPQTVESSHTHHTHLVAYLPLLIFLSLVEALGFFLMALGQSHAPATHAALILSLEGVFTCIASYLALGETLSHSEFLGCVLLLFATCLAKLGVRCIDDIDYQQVAVNCCRHLPPPGSKLISASEVGRSLLLSCTGCIISSAQWFKQKVRRNVE